MRPPFRMKGLAATRRSGIAEDEGPPCRTSGSPAAKVPLFDRQRRSSTSRRMSRKCQKLTIEAWLSNDDVDAVSAYILNLNALLPADATLDARTLPAIKNAESKHVRRRSAARRQKSSVHDGLLRKQLGVQAPRCEVATNRSALIPDPTAAKTAPSTSATVAPSRPTRPKQSAASAAPIVCPIRRAVATMPLALPLRSEGALDIKAFMFGA